MTSGGWPCYIADGFKNDCVTLLSKFEETKSARFADFVKVWQEMRFTLIYCGLNSFAELLEFTEEALSIAKQLFLPPNPDISRIGALYLVYGMYTQQPTRGLVKIRMTPDDWLHTIDFIANVREYGYADANFIFHLLCYHAAFTFTACVKEYGLERAYRRYHVTSNHMREMLSCKDLTTNQILKPVFEEIDIAELEKSRMNYENYKSILAEKEESQGMEFTSVTPLEDIVSMLTRVVDSFIPDQAAAGTSNENEANSKDIGKGRQSIRQRAFKMKNAGQNHLKSCLSTTEETGEPSTSASLVEPPENSSELPTETTHNPGYTPVWGKVYERSIFCSVLKMKRGGKPQAASKQRKSHTKAESPAEQAQSPTEQAQSPEEQAPSPEEEFGIEQTAENSSDPLDFDEDVNPAKMIKLYEESVECTSETIRRSKRAAARPTRYYEFSEY